MRGAGHATPFSLVYGCEAVLPLEIQIPSLRVAVQYDMTPDDNAKLRLIELESLDERRLQAFLFENHISLRSPFHFDSQH